MMMKTAPDLLQEKLEQLEAGLPLEACLTDLPEEEAAMLNLVATMKTVDYPLPDRATAVTQRYRLMSMAPLTVKRTNPPSPRRFSLIESWLQSPFTLAAAVAAIMLVVCASILWPNGNWGLGIGVDRAQNDASSGAMVSGDIALIPTSTPSTIATATTEPSVTSGNETAAPTTAAATATATMVASSTSTAAPTATSTIAVVAAVDPAPTNGPSGPSSQTGALEVIQGVVEIQAQDGTWQVVDDAALVKAGQRLRTGVAANAALAFFDDSRVTLGPDAEITIDTLDARLPSDGPRIIAMTQWRGQSSHEVVSRNDAGSRYMVNTPDGIGVAQGTAFQVNVAVNVQTQFIVTEGAVAVTNLNVTVIVVAGQVSTVIPGQTPNTPYFTISGEGEVSQVGPVWIVGGQAFETHDHTVIVGNPQIGDVVRVEGHLEPDRMYQADRIILISRPTAAETEPNCFTLNGTVFSVEGDSTLR